MVEQELKPVDAGRKDKQGNQIYNLNLKTKVNPASGEVMQGIVVGNHIVVEKVFTKGYQAKFGYSCKVKYNDIECSFFLNEREHNTYKDLGGIGDKIKITAIPYEYKFEGVDKKGITFEFELLNN